MVITNSKPKLPYPELSYLKVDFKEDYDWDFIIYPARVQFNYCSGSCSFTTFTPESISTHMLHQTLQESGVLPRCSKQKMGPLGLIVMDEANNILERNIQKMIVDQCGCM